MCKSSKCYYQYTEDGNAVFSNNTTAAAATSDTDVKCLDFLCQETFRQV